MVFAPLVNPAVVHHTSTHTSASITASQTSASTAASTATATKTMATPGSGTTPLSSGSTTRTNDPTHPSLGHATCNTNCKAVLGVFIPLVLLSIVVMIYLVWGRGYLKKRKERKAKAVEEGIAMEKLGEEGSVSEWEGEGEMRDVEVGGEGGEEAKKPKTRTWWRK